LKTGKKAGRNNRNLTQQETPADLLAEIKALQEAALDNDDTLVSQIILRMSQKTANSPTK